MSRRRQIQQTTEETTLIGYHAGFVSRAIAFVIDILIITGINLAITAGISLSANFLGFGFIFEPIDLTNPTWMLVTKFIVLFTMAIIAMLVFVGYPIVFWLVVGQTPGKRFMGLRVISMDNEPLRFSQAMKRFGGYWISALPLFLGYIWVLIDDDRQAWHDKFAKTKIIYDWDARHNDTFVDALQSRGAERANRNKFVRRRLRDGKNRD